MESLADFEIELGQSRFDTAVFGFESASRQCRRAYFAVTCSERKGSAHNRVAGIGDATVMEQMFMKREEAS